MGEMREALWSKLQDIDHSLAALEAVTRALAAAGSVSAEDMDNVRLKSPWDFNFSA